MIPKNQKKFKYSLQYNILSLLCINIAILLILANIASSTIPEPETLIYGQVYNLYQNSKIVISDAQIEWSVRKKGSDIINTYNTSVECMKCDDFARDGLECNACETFAYLLKIPQETDPVTGEKEDPILPLLKDNQQYDIVTVKVNGIEAFMRFQSQYGNIKEDDKEGSFFLAGQLRRSHYYQIDLELVLPVTDKDKDGLPDFWEEQYGLDISKPEDARDDKDKDGWSNIEEFQNATNPLVSNTVPSLLGSNFLIVEGAKNLFQLNIVDSDTPKDQLSVKFTYIPDNVQLIFHGESAPFAHGHIIANNESIKWEHLENGNVLLKYLFENTESNRLYVLLLDGDHEPVLETVVLNVYKPTATNATDAIFWADAFKHKEENSDALSMRFQDRSGNDNRGNYYTLSETDGYYVESNIPLLENVSLSDNAAIGINGYFELPYATPVFPPGNITMITVFKVNPSEEDQVIASGQYFEIVATGNNHPLHPGELKVADSSTAVYSNQRIDGEWVIATVTKSGGQTFIDINTLWSGGPFAYEELSELPNDPIMCGRNIWKWDFNALEWVGDVSAVMDGFFGEMLVFDRPLSYMEKWRIYGHLMGKWFNNVVSDYSQATRDMKINAITGARSEITRQLRIEADEAWMNYSDAVFANKNIDSALAALESLLPDNWQWSTVPPLVDEALQAIDSIKYNYTNDFVKLYGKDNSYVLIGGMGNDNIIGGYENDILVGGAGSDTLKGSAGRDIFVVDDGDIVIDYNVSDGDIVDISHLLVNTNKSLKKYVHFELVNDPITGEVHTSLNINANGTGESFNDATILLNNVTLRDQIDIAGLWSSGNLQTGAIRPELEIDFSVIDSQATEIPEKFASFEISFSNENFPENLTVPLILGGTAIIGQDYKLRFPVWNKESKTFDIQTSDKSIIDVKLQKGEQKLIVQVIPISDHIAENLETISISLLQKGDYYQLTRKAEPIIEITDGIDEISIIAQQSIAIEGSKTGANIVITRNGSFDISKEVNLLVKGTAENGKDFHYIPADISFAPGATQSIVNVVAYKDSENEDVEFVEVIVASGDYKLRGPASARISLYESGTNFEPGNIDNTGDINLRDAILALQICAGKELSGEIVNAAVINDRIGIEEVLYILEIIAK
ncbi:secreted protein containing Type 1 secretion, target domain protein [Candidatus Magnetomorum sp. HK-1]|nr:secreted protein containing Type 1 secretion, target domain protein [Candidatus Magnetomorum sp. HK-1]